MRQRAQTLLALVIVIGFFACLAYLIRYGKPESSSDAMLLMLGSLSGAFGATVSYFFGTTANSARKTELLAASVPPSDPPKP
jgi:lipopolysaccharide export LptBFGC system permease protein LptF